ncbi:hypothetical protein BRADI_3g04533v3, partial [Brachypodium distachyon]
KHAAATLHTWTSSTRRTTQHAAALSAPNQARAAAASSHCAQMRPAPRPDPARRHKPPAASLRQGGSHLVPQAQMRPEPPAPRSPAPSRPLRLPRSLCAATATSRPRSSVVTLCWIDAAATQAWICAANRRRTPRRHPTARSSRRRTPRRLPLRILAHTPQSAAATSQPRESPAAAVCRTGFARRLPPATARGRGGLGRTGAAAAAR